MTSLGCDLAVKQVPYEISSSEFLHFPFLQIILSFHYSILLLVSDGRLLIFPGFDHFFSIPDLESSLHSASPSIRDVSYPDFVIRCSLSSVLLVLPVL